MQEVLVFFNNTKITTIQNMKKLLPSKLVVKRLAYNSLLIPVIKVL